MKLAHCSDLHLLSHAGSKWIEFANKRWIGAMNLLSNRSRHYHVDAFRDMVVDFKAQNITHVLCTGDISNLGLEREFQFAKQIFDQISLGTEGVTVVPGNHDAYVAEGGRHFSQIFGDYARSDAALSDLGGQVEEHWPVVRVRDHVVLIGLSTSRETPWFTAYGEIGAAQLSALDTILRDPRIAGKTVIVALHHPPAGKRAANRMRGLRDHRAFADVLSRHQIQLVLHGHEHRDLHDMLPGRDTPVPVLGIQSGTYAASDSSRQGRYRILEIGENGAISHHLRVWHPERRCFEADPSVVHGA